MPTDRPDDATEVRAAPLFARLVDDAGLFPPEELEMGAALARHRAERAQDNPVLTGRFVCPAARLSELCSELAPGDLVRLSLVVAPLEQASLRAALELVASDDRLELSNVEGPFDGASVPDLSSLGVPAFVELPVTGDWKGAFEAVAGVGAGAGASAGVKIRCGGVRAELFPGAEQLGSLVHACVGQGLSFKATAGLHHALRYRDGETGFDHHGFLNLLLATCRAADGAPIEATVAALESSDAVALADEARSVRAELAMRARHLFVSYGSCSTREPVEDLCSLGLLRESAPESERP